MRAVFGHGQLRLYMLVLLERRPLHGYEIIRDLQARFDGLYCPSAGTIYPRLAKLQAVGLVERSDEGRKSTYRLTSAGRQELETRRDEVVALEELLAAAARRLAHDKRRLADEPGAPGPPGATEPQLRALVTDLIRDPDSIHVLVRTVGRLGGHTSGHTSGHPGPPTADQLADVAEILRDAFCRIRRVLDEPG